MTTTMTSKYEQVLSEGVADVVEIVATVEGIAPGMLMHSAKAMAVAKEWEAANGGGRKKVIPPAAVEAEWGTYRDADGALYLPAVSLQRSLIEAGKSFRSTSRKMATLTREVAAGVQIPVGVEGYTLRDAAGEPIRDYLIDVRRAVVQRAAIMRARPLIPEWSAEIRLWLDPVALTPEVALKLLMWAGRMVGVGDYRPERSGPFGRFAVQSFTDTGVV